MTSRPRVPKNAIKKGTWLQVDDCFTCVPPNAIVEVYGNEDYGLYFECREGRHLLDGQLDFETKTEYVGVSIIPKPV